MPSPEVLRRIYQQVVAACESCPLRAPWDSLPAGPYVLRLPREPARLLAELSGKFPEEALIAAGVARRLPEGTFALGTRLNDPETLVVPLRRGGTGDVADLLTKDGCVSDRDLPIFTAHGGDTLSLGTLDREQRVLAAFSIEDVAVLRACEIPATLATGLACLSSAEVDRLAQGFGCARDKGRRVENLENRDFQAAEWWETNEGPATRDPLLGRERIEPRRFPGEVGLNQGHPRPPAPGRRPLETPQGSARKLVLVAWSPASLTRDVPAEFSAVADYLRDLERYMGLGISEIDVWQPAPEEIDRLRFILRQAEPTGVRDVLLDSLYEQQGRLADFGDRDPQSLPVPADLPAAMKMLREAMFDAEASTVANNRRRIAYREVERCLYEQIIGPMAEAAMRAPTPLERALALATTQGLQVFLSSGTLIQAKLAKVLGERGDAGLDALPLDEIKKLQEIGKHVTRLVQESEQCRQQNVMLVQVSPRPASLRLPGSA